MGVSPFITLQVPLPLWCLLYNFSGNHTDFFSFWYQLVSSCSSICAK